MQSTKPNTAQNHAMQVAAGVMLGINRASSKGATPKPVCGGELIEAATSSQQAPTHSTARDIATTPGRIVHIRTSTRSHRSAVVLNGDIIATRALEDAVGAVAVRRATGMPKKSLKNGSAKNDDMGTRDMVGGA